VGASGTSNVTLLSDRLGAIVNLRRTLHPAARGTWTPCTLWKSRLLESLRDPSFGNAGKAPIYQHSVDGHTMYLTCAQSSPSQAACSAISKHELMTAGMLGREIDLNCGAARLPLPHLFPRCLVRFLSVVPHLYARALPPSVWINMVRCRSNRRSMTKHNPTGSLSVNKKKTSAVETNTEGDTGGLIIHRVLRPPRKPSWCSDTFPAPKSYAVCGGSSQQRSLRPNKG